MKSSRLRDRIDIEEMAENSTGTGNKREIWTPIHTELPAELLPLSGSELYQAQQRTDIADFKATIRFIPGVTSKHRVVAEGTVYKIVGPPMNTGRRDRELTMHLQLVT